MKRSEKKRAERGCSRRVARGLQWHHNLPRARVFSADLTAVARPGTALAVLAERCRPGMTEEDASLEPFDFARDRHQGRKREEP